MERRMEGRFSYAISRLSRIQDTLRLTKSRPVRA